MFHFTPAIDITLSLSLSVVIVLGAFIAKRGMIFYAHIFGLVFVIAATVCALSVWLPFYDMIELRADGAESVVQIQAAEFFVMCVFVPIEMARSSNRFPLVTRARYFTASICHLVLLAYVLSLGIYLYRLAPYMIHGLSLFVCALIIYLVHFHISESSIFIGIRVWLAGLLAISLSLVGARSAHND